MKNKNPVSKCEDCGSYDEKELYKQDITDKSRCWVCFGKKYPLTHAGKQIRGEID